MFDHGGQRRLFDAADRVTHRFALEIRRRRDVFIQRDHRIQRRVDQRADAHQRQALIGEEMQLRLIGDGEVGLFGGHQPRRQRRIGRRHDLDVQPCGLEGADLLGHHNRRVIGVDVPVEHQRQLFGRAGLASQSGAEQQPAEGLLIMVGSLLFKGYTLNSSSCRKAATERVPMSLLK